MALPNSKQAGFFLWETMLLSIFLLVMAGGVGMYLQAAQLRVTEAVEGRADYLARAQMSYVQALLQREGRLPDQLDYLGEEEDLRPNDSLYQMQTVVVEDNGLWQVMITVFWEAGGRYGKQEYTRCLVRYR